MSTRSSGDDVRVALVNMPFASASRPSIQMGLLSAIGEAAGYHIQTAYLNLDLAAELGFDLYEQLCEHRGHMTGEWLFALAAFGPDMARPAEDYFRLFPSEAEWARSIGQDVDVLVDLRSRILPAYVSRCVDEGDWGGITVLGFSVTFQQTVASLALARQVKERFPRVRVVFGGANVDGGMGAEVVRSFPWVDAVVAGEGDVAFPAVLAAVERGADIANVPGVLTRGLAGVVRGAPSPPLRDMDQLPTPDYRSYFSRARSLGLLEELAPGMRLPFEGARGCWWGAKHHCTFCGLNGQGMTFRSKAPERVLQELGDLSEAHDSTSFEAVDNILDRGYIDTLFARIDESKLDYRFFYEVKANMGREHIRKLARGGVREVQPGIESLSTPILKLMRKGCTMLQNVLCLKWCAYYGVGVAWNLIHGFPGEREQDFVDQLRVLKVIPHLQPPNGFDRIWLERFSPYFDEAERFGVRNVRASRSYGEVYPPHVDLDEIAYFFDYEMPAAFGESAAAASSPVLRETREWVEHWHREWTSDRRPTLSFRRTSSGVLVDRGAGPRKRRTVSLVGPTAEMLLFCSESIHSARAVHDHLRECGGADFPLDDVREALQEFCDAGLMLTEDDKFLALPLPVNPNW